MCRSCNRANTQKDAHRKMCVSVCQNVIFLQFIQFARQCALKGLRSVKTTPHNENHSFLRRLRSRCCDALLKFCALTLLRFHGNTSSITTEPSLVSTQNLLEAVENYRFSSSLSIETTLSIECRRKTASSGHIFLPLYKNRGTCPGFYEFAAQIYFMRAVARSTK